MTEILGAAIGAVAVIAIPLIAWFSRRTTKEGRLLLRVERLGAAYAVMPDSEERAQFEQHLRAAITNLNDWLDVEKRARRKLQRRISVLAYVLGMLLVFIALPFVGPDNSVASSVLGIVVGSLIAVVNVVSGLLIERAASTKARREAEAAAAEEQTQRMEAIRRGESSTGGGAL